MSELREFSLELADLMEKYAVEIVAKDEFEGYSECGEDIQIRLEHPFCYKFDPALGDRVTADSLRKAASLEHPND